MLEVTDAAISVWGAERVGMHLNLRRNSHDIDDSTPEATFSHVARELGLRKIAFIIGRESLDAPRLGPTVNKVFGGIYIANQDFTQETAERVMAQNDADAVALRQIVPRQSRPAGALRPQRAAQQTG
jgi:2,4-dienoyl-CoA reductase-like NADH-dependent reductase (Old Yellow Enzyme family)